MQKDHLIDQHEVAGVACEQMTNLETLFKAIRLAASVDTNDPNKKPDLWHIGKLASFGEERAGTHANDYDVRREDLEREIDRLHSPATA